jgi:hypothetical protein
MPSVWFDKGGSTTPAELGNVVDDAIRATSGALPVFLVDAGRAFHSLAELILDRPSSTTPPAGAMRGVARVQPSVGRCSTGMGCVHAVTCRRFLLAVAAGRRLSVE